MTNFCSIHKQFYADYCVYCGVLLIGKLANVSSQAEVYNCEIILTNKDKKIIRECLNYCYHRIKNHNKFISAYKADIDRIRKQL